MNSIIDRFLQQQNILHHTNQSITICSVKDDVSGMDLAKRLLYAIVDRKTALYLSGGRTPRELYEQFAQEETLFPGAVGMVDERFGGKWHERSNEKMMRETGLLRYLEMRDIPFYPILQRPHPNPSTPVKQAALRPALKGEGIVGREETAQAYDEKVRELHAIFQRSIALLGIGNDGHTAGMPAAGNSEIETKNKELKGTYDFVTSYRDMKGTYGERVTMSFLGLSMMDLLVVLVFGDDKKEALEEMFTDGSEEEIPARFYKRPQIAEKTVLITDQKV